MLSRRLNLLFINRMQLSDWKFHSNYHRHGVNLTFTYRPKRSNNFYMKNKILPIESIQRYSNLSVNIANDALDNKIDDADINHEMGDKITEDGYMYSILSRSDKYQKTISQPIIPERSIPDETIEEILAKDHEDCSVNELLEDFKILSYHAHMNSVKASEEKHSKLFDHLKKYIPDLVDEQVWDLLRYMELWSNLLNDKRSGLFRVLLNEIDCTLQDRYNAFTHDEKLYSCDLLYRNGFFRYSKFSGKFLMKMGMKPRQFSVESYVHYMFLLNIARKASINMYELEYALEYIIDKLNVEELGILSLAFFKTRSPIRNPALLDKIIGKCIVEMDTVSCFTICAIMKISRYSLGFKSIGQFRKLLQAFESRVHSVSTPCLIHSSHAAASILVYEKPVLDAIINRFQLLIPTARLKDLERMLFVLVIFNYPKDLPIYELIINELRNPARKREIQKFYKTLTTSLMYLTHAGIYPLDIIQRVMNHDYLREVYKNNSFEIGQEYLLLETALKIEVPEYDGPTLPKKIRNYLVKKFSAAIAYGRNPDDNIQSYQKFLFEVIYYAKQIVGSDKILTEQLLPQYRRNDIVYCTDTENNFVSPQEFMEKNLPIGAIRFAPKLPPGYKLSTLILASHNHILRDTNIACGTINSKSRLLEKIGYSPVVLLYSRWTECRTVQAKKVYLAEILTNKKNF